MLYVLLPTYRDLEMTGRCVNSLNKTLHEPYILLINYSWHRIGCPKAVNILFKAALSGGATEILLVDNDVEIETDNWIEEFRKHRGVVGSLGAIPEGDKWVYLNPDWEKYPWYSKSEIPYNGPPYSSPYICFALVYMKIEVLLDVGLLDENFTPGYYEDNDFGMRAWQKGYPCTLVPKVTHRHRVGSTMGKIPNFYPTKQAAYHMEKWGWLIKGKTPPELVELLEKRLKEMQSKEASK